MTDTNRKNADEKAQDVIHGRNLAGASYGANEREQTEDARRAARDKTDEAGEFVTDAEIESREDDITP